MERGERREIDGEDASGALRKLPDSSFWVAIRPLVDTAIEAEDMVKIIPPSPSWLSAHELM